MSVTDFPSSSGYGSPIQKILKFRDGEVIVDSFGVLTGVSKAQTELLKQESPNILREKDIFVLVTKRGMGYALTIEDIEGIKRNGKRVMKVRDNDSLIALQPLDGLLTMFTKKASGLSIAKKDIPVRNSAAVGVILMSVRDDDEIIYAHSWKTRKKFKLHPSSGRVKEIAGSSVTKGRRGLKGTKVMAKGELNTVELL